MRFINTARLVAFLGLTGLAIACSDLLVNPAPITSRSLALSLSYSPQSNPGSQTSAFDKVDVARVVVRQAGTVIADTTLTFTVEPGAESHLRFTLDARFADTPVEVEVELRRDGVVLFRGSTTVTLREAGTTPVEIPIQGVATLVEITPLTAPIAVIGGTVQLRASALFSTGDTIRGAPLVWRSLRPDIISVSAEGLATGLTEGVVNIEASFGTAADTVVVVVRATVTRVVVQPLASPIVVGATVPAVAVAEDAGGHPLSRVLEWSSSDPTVVEVVPGLNLLRGVRAGSATVSASVEGVTGSTPVSVVNSRPSLQSLDPIGSVVGGASATVVLRGSGFIPASVAFFGGTPRPATLVGSTELHMSLTAADLDDPGNFTVHVENPAPGGGSSEVLHFTLVSPVPVLDAIDPAQAISGRQTPLVVTLRGSGFVPGSIGRWSRNNRPTQFVSGTELRMEVPASDLALPGGALISVINPAPGGGISNEVFFTIAAPVPAITALVPDSVLIGSGFLTLAVRGEGFVPSSIVRWDGADRPTNFFSGTEIRVALPASDFQVARVAQVTVFTPTPGGGVSAPVPFTIYNPRPVITDITPDTVPLGAASATLTLDGTGFMPNSVVRWEGANRPTVYVADGADLRVTIPASDLAVAGSYGVTVFTPAPGGGVSNEVDVVVANPAPVITSLSPDTVVAESDDFTLVVDGTGLIPNSVVRWNGAARPTTYDTETGELRAAIPASDIEEEGEALITVFNPGPGGGTSAPAELIIDSPPSIELSADSASFVAAAGDDEIPSQNIAITNGGGGTLGGLEIDIDYDDVEIDSWLDADLSSTTAPATLTLTASASDLDPGTYRATVEVFSEDADDSESIEVVITVLSPFSYWAANGNYNDSGSLDNDGSPTAGVSLSPDGIFAGAFDFAGGQITAPDAGLESATQVTLATWVNMDSTVSGFGINRFVTMQPERAVLRLDGQFGPGSNSLHFYVFTNNGPVGIYANGILSWRQCWVHVAATYDGVFARLYYNGFEVATGQLAGTLNPANGEGIRMASTAEPLFGLMDDVRVYGRVLSGAEIAGLAVGPPEDTCGGEAD